MQKKYNGSSVLGEKLRCLREKKGMSQRELGKKLRLSDSSISAYENGTSMPTVPTLQALALIFGVELELLMNEQQTYVELVKERPLYKKSKPPLESVNELYYRLTNHLTWEWYYDGLGFLERMNK